MPVMAPALVPAIMSTTMPFCSRALSTPRWDMPRAAPPPRATPMRTPRRSWTSRSRPLASDRPQGGCGRRLGDLEIAAGEVAEVGHGRGHGGVALQQPGDADLVAPAAGRHVERLQAADRGVARGSPGRNRPRDRRVSINRTARSGSRSAWTSKMMRLASCHSAACRRISSSSSSRPSSRSDRNRTSGRPRHSSESLNTASFSPTSRSRSMSRSAARRVAGDSWISASIIGARWGAVPKKCFRRLPA